MSRIQKALQDPQLRFGCPQLLLNRLSIKPKSRCGAEQLPFPGRVFVHRLPPSQQQNESNESFASLASEHLDDDGAHTEDNHVTHMHKIGGRQSISKAVGGLMPRRLSRTRSANVLSSGNGNMIIGVSVEEATVESAEDVDTCCARVHAPGALRNQPSRLTMAGSSPVKDSWVTKAKGFTQKFRRKGKRVDPTSS